MPSNTKSSISSSSKPVYQRKALLAAALGSLFLLAACAQQSEPNYYEINRANTQSDARHRAQGNDSTVAPSQLQLGFGGQKDQPNQTVNQSATNTVNKVLPHNLADTRTYLGTIPCSSATACSVQRMALTLAPDGQWRARNTDLNGQLNDTQMGCWVLTNDNPIRLNLKIQDNIYATMEFSQSNVLKLVRLNGQQPLLQSNLTRQADVDPIDELAEKPAENCNTHN